MRQLVQKLKEGECPSYEEMKEELIGRIPLLGKLSETPQDPVWHAEGNVEIHTRMVVDELYEELEGRNVDGEKRAVLVLAALLHDVAKPLTTRKREEKDRTKIIAPSHAKKGRSYLAFRLAVDSGLSYRSLRSLLNLVGLHHRPKWYVKDGKSEGHFAALKRRVEPERLYLLELADIRGRECQDQDEQIEHIEFFRMFSEEYGVWDENPFADWCSKIHRQTDIDDPSFIERAAVQGLLDYREGRIHTPGEAASRARANGLEFPKLVVTCGPSGSGKSRWIRDHLGDHEVVSLDELRGEICGDRTDQSENGRVLQEAKERLKEPLRDNGSVVWDSTNIRRSHRNLPIGIGSDYGAYITLVVFQIPENILKKRNSERSRTVPESVIDNQIEGFQFPSINEAHRTIFVGPEGVLYDTRDDLSLP